MTTDPYDSDSNDEPSEDEVNSLYEDYGSPTSNSDTSGNIPDDDD